MKLFKLAKTRYKFLMGLTIALISIRIYLAVMFGYFIAHFLSKKIRSFIFTIGQYRIHIHHWLVGSATIALAILLDISPLVNQVFFAFLGGVIFQGILSYPDWYRIITKKAT